MRNLIFPINNTLILLTIVGYFLYLFPGVILHLLLAAFQLSCMLGYLITRKDHTYSQRIQLYIYTAITVPLVLSAVITGNELLYQIMVFGSVILALYFSAIIYQIEKKYNDAQK